MRCEPTMMHPPDVDFLVLTHPAQSVSEYTSIVSACCRGYLNTSLGCALRYLANRLRAATARSVGLDMNLHISFAAYMTPSGRSAAR